MEGTSSPTSTPRASYFPQAQTRLAAGKSTKQEPASPGVPELIPDIAPIALRRCGSPSVLGARDSMPPRPFSTPPRISSRASSDITCVTCEAELSRILTPCSSPGAVYEISRLTLLSTPDTLAVFVFVCSPLYGSLGI